MTIVGLENWLWDDLYMQFFNRVVGLDLDVAKRYGSLMARAKKNGHNPNAMDGLVAATAEANGMAVVTLNRKDFEKLGWSWWSFRGVPMGRSDEVSRAWVDEKRAVGRRIGVLFGRSNEMSSNGVLFDVLSAGFEFLEVEDLGFVEAARPDFELALQVEGETAFGELHGLF